MALGGLTKGNIGTGVVTGTGIGGAAVDKLTGSKIGGQLDDLGGQVSDGAKKTIKSMKAPGAPNLGTPNIQNINQVPQLRDVPTLTPGTMQRTQLGQVGDTTGAQIQNGQGFDQAAAAQSQLLSQLGMQASGQGPSIADMQMRQGMDANLAATRAQLASTRNANPSLARQTMQTSADIQAKTAQDSAMARLQEQMQAQQQLGAFSSQVRGQANTEGQAQAGLNQQANLANMQKNLSMAVTQGQISQQEAADIYRQQFLAQAQNAQLGQAHDQQAIDNDWRTQYFNNYTMPMGIQGANAAQANADYNARFAQTKQNADLATGVANGAGQLGMSYATGGLGGGKLFDPAATTAGPQITQQNNLGGTSTYPTRDGVMQAGPPRVQDANGDYQTSDERAKKNIRNADGDIKDFLDQMGRHKYEYNDPNVDGEGTRVSPMAQELEKSKMGDSAVIDNGGKKMVDYQKMMPFLAAATSYLHDRVKKLEG